MATFEANPIGAMRVVQSFGPTDWVSRCAPYCEAEGCASRSVRMYADSTKKGFCVCEKHDTWKPETATS
jgi:hypothetical protein